MWPGSGALIGAGVFHLFGAAWLGALIGGLVLILCSPYLIAELWG